MINEFTTQELSDLLYDDLSEIEDEDGTQTEVILTQPNTDSVYPCRIIDTPLESINKSDNATPVFKTFQVSIEHWAEKQRDCMDMANNTDLKMRKRNFTRTSSSPVMYDDIVKKYKFITTYEVKYNGLYNSFVYIR